MIVDSGRTPGGDGGHSAKFNLFMAKAPDWALFWRLWFERKIRMSRVSAVS